MEIRDAISVTTAFQPSDATLKRHYISLAEYPRLRDVKGPVVFAITLNNKRHWIINSSINLINYLALSCRIFIDRFLISNITKYTVVHESIRTLTDTFSERISKHLL